jgi:plastocyanin
MLALLAVACGQASTSSSGDLSPSPTASTLEPGDSMEKRDGSGAAAGDEEEEEDEGYYVDVEGEDLRFVPRTFDVMVTQEIEFINKDAVLHNISIPAAGISVDVEPGEEIYTPPISLGPGRYAFSCRIHGSQGMRGTFTMTSDREIIVQRRGY